MLSKISFALLGAMAAALLLLIVVPLAAVFAGLDWEAVPRTLARPVVWQALRLSLGTTLISTAIIGVFGLPLSYVLARYRFKGLVLLDILVDLPMVLPPAVAGVALLAAFGRQGLVGALFGWQLAFSTLAVVLAQIFVAAPFFLRAARASFAAVDVNLEKVSLTLGRSPWQTFWRVTMPLSWPGLWAGLIMTWARALGEFGATIMFAGNLRGVTQTLPLAIYTTMATDFRAAMLMSALMIVIAFVVLFMVRFGLRQG